MLCFTLLVINTAFTSVHCATFDFLTVLSPSSDCDKGERSAGVEEEV